MNEYVWKTKTIIRDFLSGFLYNKLCNNILIKIISTIDIDIVYLNYLRTFNRPKPH